MISTIEITSDNVDDYKNKFLNEVYKKGNYREITSRESANLQGFPKDYILHKDERIAKKQLGNAVSTNVIYYLASSILKTNVLLNQDYESTRKRNSTRKV